MIYKFQYPGCKSTYIGKTDRTLYERTNEHGTLTESTIYQHLNSCASFLHIRELHHIFIDDVNIKEFFTQQIRNTIDIIDQSRNCNILLFKEAFHIKQHNPILNKGVKASKELQLF